MKVLRLTALTGLLATTLWAQSITKEGIVVVAPCVEQGHFTECPLSYNASDEPLVLYVAEDMRYYTLDLSGVTRREMDTGFARYGTVVTGTLKGDQLIVDRYEAPAPREDTLFKGCL